MHRSRLAIFALALIVVAGTAWAMVHFYSTTTVEGSDVTATSGIFDGSEAPDGPSVLVVGDSFTAGSDENQGPEWPQLMAVDRGWVEINEGYGGTGYVAGEEAGTSYEDRAKEYARDYIVDYVVLAGGINDAGKFSTAQIAAAARRTIKTFETSMPGAQVVLLSPFGNAEPSTDILDMEVGLRKVAKRSGVPYIEVTNAFTGKPNLIGDDGIHPNDAGHQVIADIVGAGIEKLEQAA